MKKGQLDTGSKRSYEQTFRVVVEYSSGHTEEVEKVAYDYLGAIEAVIEQLQPVLEKNSDSVKSIYTTLEDE